MAGWPAVLTAGVVIKRDDGSGLHGHGGCRYLVGGRVLGVVRNTRPDRTPSTTIELTRWVPLGKKKKKKGRRRWHCHPRRGGRLDNHGESTGGPLDGEDRGRQAGEQAISSNSVSSSPMRTRRLPLSAAADPPVQRPAGPSEIETGREGQERTVREVWRRVRALDYTRPGV